MTRLLACAIVLFSFCGPMVWAQDFVEPKFDESKEAEIANIAKKRLYPGGRDEEELKVQSQITNPTRKLSPQAEVKASQEE